MKSQESLVISFVLKSAGKPSKAHQVFLHTAHTTLKTESTFVFESSDKGKYAVELVSKNFEK